MNGRNVEVLIIGAGPAGYVAGIRLGQLGKEVLVVDKGQIGGVCLNIGCIPTKALLYAGNMVRTAEAASKMGLALGRPDVDLEQLNRWKDGIVGRLVKGVESLFRVNGVEYRKAEASFVDCNTVLVGGVDGQETVAPAAIIVATGSQQVSLPGFEPDGESIITSNEAVELRSVPERLLIIGAGSVGLEWATIYSCLGSRVKVVEILDQPLPGTDSDIAAALLRILRRQNIEVNLKTTACKVERTGGLVVTLSVEGEKSTIEVDQILVAVGRRPSTKGYGLEAAGVSLTEDGSIKVDDERRTSVPHIYAAGDVTGPPLLAHKAMREGVVAAEVIAGLPSKFRPKGIPNCVFTQPEVATVGLSEQEARSAGYEVSVGTFPLAASGKALVLGETHGLAKVVCERESGVLLGMHLLAPEASALIGEAVLALENGSTGEELASIIHPHPTLAEIIPEAAANVHKKSIHIPNR